MLRIDIITCQPALLAPLLKTGIFARAIKKKQAQIVVHNLRDYGTGPHKQIDDYPYGGGAGMVLQIEPIDKCVACLKRQRAYDAVIYLSPLGVPLSQTQANRLALFQNLILLCGHYEGIDERVRKHLVDEDISIGPYVLSGGELPALILCDAILRLIPNVLGNADNALHDSFQNDTLAPPVYTRPAKYKGIKVPDVLLSGHAKNIQNWREQEAAKRRNNHQ